MRLRVVDRDARDRPDLLVLAELLDDERARLSSSMSATSMTRECSPPSPVFASIFRSM
jgi:hypothetical protein